LAADPDRRHDQQHHGGGAEVIDDTLLATNSSRATVHAAKRMRALMVHWDGGGNMPPQRALARELKRRGHDVHVLTHNKLAETVRADGGTFHTLDTTPQFDPTQPHTLDEEKTWLQQRVCGSPAFAADFLNAYDALRPDICLIDAMLITTLNAAIESGVYFAAVNHLAWNPAGAAFLNSFAAGLPGRAAGSTFYGLLDRVPLVLATSYADFGTQLDVAPHIHFVGPIREPVAPAPPPRRFPDRPFVLVSLSSNFQEQDATLRRICEALAPLPLEVLVTTGRSIAPEALAVSGCVEAQSFVPHDAVLPSVDLAVTHAGLGTLMYSAGAGVPCLCLPNGRDQNNNAARVEALGLGRVLSPSATASEIREKVKNMLRDEALRSTCRSFAARVSRFGDLARAADLAEGVFK
jgi:UDP:flavonoid glycosyltransferase YjiC (YdhE family)